MDPFATRGAVDEVSLLALDNVLGGNCQGRFPTSTRNGHEKHRDRSALSNGAGKWELTLADG